MESFKPQASENVPPVMNVLFGDGHVERIKPRQVKKFLAAVKSANGPVTWPPQ